jgi:hypothetical protein
MRAHARPAIFAAFVPTTPPPIITTRAGRHARNAAQQNPPPPRSFFPGNARPPESPCGRRLPTLALAAAMSRDDR